MSDSQGQNRVLGGPGTRNDTRPYEPPPPPENAPWLPPKDFDSATWRLPWIGYGSDFGFFLGQGLEHRRYGFRKDHFSSRHVFRAGYRLRRDERPVRLQRHLQPREQPQLPGARLLLVRNRGPPLLRVRQRDGEQRRQGLLPGPRKTRSSSTRRSPGRSPGAPASPWDPSAATPAPAGTTPLSSTKPHPPSTVATTSARSGAHALFLLDGRDNVQYPRRGGLLAVRGTVWPEVWDIRQHVRRGERERQRLPLGRTVAHPRRARRRPEGLRDLPVLRCGFAGRRRPREGALSMRRTRRSAASAPAASRVTRPSTATPTCELRLGRATIFVPTHFGIFGLYDVGRVWYEGDGDPRTPGTRATVAASGSRSSTTAARSPRTTPTARKTTSSAWAEASPSRRARAR